MRGSPYPASVAGCGPRPRPAPAGAGGQWPSAATCFRWRPTASSPPEAGPKSAPGTSRRWGLPAPTAPASVSGRLWVWRTSPQSRAVQHRSVHLFLRARAPPRGRAHWTTHLLPWAAVDAEGSVIGGEVGSWWVVRDASQLLIVVRTSEMLTYTDCCWRWHPALEASCF